MVCRTHKYADGGKVVKDHAAPVKPALKPERPPANALGSGAATRAAAAMRNTTAQRMKDLDL